MVNAALKKLIFILLLASSAASAEEGVTSKLSVTEAGPTATDETALLNPLIKNYATRDLISAEKQIYKFSFFSMAGGRAVDINRGGTSVGAYNYIGLSKKIDSNDQVGFRYVFYYDTAGYKFNPSKLKDDYVGYQTDTGDAYFSYSRYSIAKFADWNLSGSGRVYLPLSRFSQSTKLVTQLRTEFFFDQPLFNFSNFNFSHKTDYYVQTQKDYLDGDAARRDDGTYPSTAVKGSKQWNTENYIEIDANLSKKFSFKPRMGFEDSWYYGSNAENIEPRHDSDFKTQLGFDYRAAKALSFTFATENRTALLNRKDAVAFGRPEDTRWIFITYASY